MLALPHAGGSLTLVPLLFRFDPFQGNRVCCTAANAVATATLLYSSPSPARGAEGLAHSSLFSLLSLLSVPLTIFRQQPLTIFRFAPYAAASVICVTSAYASCLSPLSVCVPLVLLSLSLPSPLAACVPLLGLLVSPHNACLPLTIFFHTFCFIHRFPLTVCCMSILMLSPSVV